jgi:hypothetical protein
VAGGWEEDIANNTINAPGQNAIVINSGTPGTGSGMLLNNTVTNVPSGYSALVNDSPGYQIITGTSASAYNNSSGIITQTCVEGGLQVAGISNGSYTEYNNLNLTGMTYFQARVASDTSGGNIVIHLGSSTGTVIGTCPVPGTGAWHNWINVGCNLSATATGTQNVYLVYTGGSGNLLNLEWFNFQPNVGGLSSRQPKNGGLYNLFTQASEANDMVLDNGGSTSNGGPIVQEPLTIGDTNQEWEFVNVGEGYYNLICQKSGLALDNEGSTSAGNGVWQWSQGAGNTNQEWMFLFLGDNTLGSLVCLTSGMALDNNNSTTAGTAIIQEPVTQAPYSGAITEQGWYVEPIPQSGGIYVLRCQNSGMVLDNNGATSNGSPPVQNYQNTDDTNQMWQLFSVGSGYYNVASVTDGMALDNEGSTTAGNGVYQWALQGGNTNQEWKLVNVGEGNYNLVCLTSGMTLDNGGSGNTGTTYVQEPVTSGDTNQEYTLLTLGIPQADMVAASYSSASSGVSTQSCS